MTQRSWRMSPFRSQSAFVIGQRSSEDICCVGTIRLSIAVWSCESLGFAQGFCGFASKNQVNSPAVVSFLNKALWHWAFGNTFTETSSPEVSFSDTASLFLPPSSPIPPRPSETSLESTQFLKLFWKEKQEQQQQFKSHEDFSRLRKTSDYPLQHTPLASAALTEATARRHRTYCPSLPPGRHAHICLVSILSCISYIFPTRLSPPWLPTTNLSPLELSLANQTTSRTNQMKREWDRRQRFPQTWDAIDIQQNILGLVKFIFKCLGTLLLSIKP